MYKVKKVKSIKIWIDGNVYDWTFSNYALAVLDDEFEEGSISIISKAESRPVSAISKIIYAGIKFSAEEQEIDVNYRIVANSMLFDAKLVNKIMRIVTEAVDINTGDAEMDEVIEDEEKNE